MIEISNSMQFIEGTQITLQAINVGRYYFDAWQIAGADAVVDGDQITFTMNQDVTVTALFIAAAEAVHLIQKLVAVPEQTEMMKLMRRLSTKRLR